MTKNNMDIEQRKNAALTYIDVVGTGTYDDCYHIFKYHGDTIRELLQPAATQSNTAELVEVTVNDLHEKYDDDELETADEFLKMLARDFPNGIKIV